MTTLSNGLTFAEHLVMQLRNMGVDMTPIGERSWDSEVMEATGAEQITLRAYTPRQGASSERPSTTATLYVYHNTQEVYVNVGNSYDWNMQVWGTPYNVIETHLKEHGVIGFSGESYKVIFE